MFGIAALVLGAVTLLERQTDRYLELTNPAVERFHAQLAAGQYAAIYDGAGRRNATEKDY